MGRKFAVVIVALFLSISIAFAEEGKMLFLTVVQKSNSLRVVKAQVVTGTPRGNSVRPASALYEQHASDGSVLETGSVPMPPPLTFDVPDESGKLSGGVVHQDSIIFSFRVPYHADAATLHFFCNPPVICALH
jgi:hypothetical protein